jgi:hypothetical protein
MVPIVQQMGPVWCMLEETYVRVLYANIIIEAL